MITPSNSEALQHAVEALRRSNKPLTIREILKQIPPPSRRPPAELEQLLEATDAGVCRWAAKSGVARYWTRTPEAAADDALLELLAHTALTAAALRTKLAKYLPAYPAAERSKLVPLRLATLVEAAKLYQYPRAGKFRTVRYSAKPAEAADYVGPLRQQLQELAQALAAAGVTREALLEALSENGNVAVEEPVPAPREEPAPGKDLRGRILDHLETKPGGIGVTQLREELGLARDSKAGFDEAVLTLYREHRVYLDRHDFPQGLTEMDKDELVTDGAGNYFVVIGLRDRDAESIS